LKFVHNAGEKVLVAAVERDWKYIQEIEVPTAAVVVAAVKQDYHAFEYVSIRRRTEPVQLAAVRTDWRCIQYLQRASEKVQMEAVKASKDALKLIKNPAPAVKEFCA
jgi:predicted methyltransferase